MKNTTFRKKALLSSVAMLLVAFIALGSATFAWFTANPTVEATGLQATATTAAGLSVISQSEKDWYAGANKTVVWDNTTVINTNQDYTKNTPELAGTGTASEEEEGTKAIVFSSALSYNYDEAGDATFTTVKAKNESGYEMTALTDVQDVSAGFYKENIFVKSTVAGESTAVKSAKVTIDATDAPVAAAIRVMLKDNNGKIIGTWSVSGNDNKYIGNAATTGYELKDATYLASGTAVTKYFDSEDAIDIPATQSETANYVTVYVWLDGEDQACYTENVNLNKILNSITVALSTEVQ